jgi:hypothetical protein
MFHINYTPLEQTLQNIRIATDGLNSKMDALNQELKSIIIEIESGPDEFLRPEAFEMVCDEKFSQIKYIIDHVKLIDIDENIFAPGLRPADMNYVATVLTLFRDLLNIHTKYIESVKEILNSNNDQGQMLKLLRSKIN